jgi:hypothetical protein
MVSEVRTTSSTGGEKGVKAERYDLIPVEALATVAQLYGKGAEKYAAHNWRRGYEWSKSYAAMQRHTNAFWNGEDLDPEMQLPHLASVVFHALTLMTFMKEQPGFDDRYKATFNDDQLENLRKKLIGDPNVSNPWRMTPAADSIYNATLDDMDATSQE